MINNKVLSKLLLFVATLCTAGNLLASITVNGEASLYKATAGSSITIPIIASVPSADAGLDALGFEIAFDNLKVTVDEDSSDWHDDYTGSTFNFS